MLAPSKERICRHKSLADKKFDSKFVKKEQFLLLTYLDNLHMIFKRDYFLQWGIDRLHFRAWFIVSVNF